MVVNEENIGPTGSLHKGIDLVNSKYVARLDADDLMLEDRLEKQVKFMEENPEYGIVGSWTRNIDIADNLSAINRLCTTDKGVRAFLNVESPFYHPAVMIRTSVLKDNNLNYDLNIRVAVEYKLWNEILHHSKGCNLPEVLTHYRVGDSSSLTASNPFKKLQEYLNVRESINRENNEDALLKSLKIERKEKKNIFDCMAIFNALNGYLNSHMDKNDEDYGSVKSCVYSRIYNACTSENKTLLGTILGKLMGLYKVL